MHAGFEVPLLSELARRITSMVSSSSSCERIFSTYEFIHSPQRNRLEPSRANDLVYVFRNMRLLDKFGEPEKFADWVAEEIPSDDEATQAQDVYEGGHSESDDSDDSMQSEDAELEESEPEYENEEADE